MFAPVVFEAHRREAWPAGTLVVDHVPFRIRARDAAGRPIAGGMVAFNVLAAVGYEDRRARLWSMQSSPTANASDWNGFFTGLGGQPDRVVCDAHGGITSAVRACWPTADIYYCEWHLADKMRLRLRRADMHLPSEPLWRALDARAVDYAFGSLYLWEHYKVKAYRARGRCRELQVWIDRWDPVICAQLDLRPRRDERPNTWPVTTAALELRLDPVKARLNRRRFAFRNRQRMDRLLMLMQLELNGQADAATYARAIREWLTARNGRTPPRRALADALGHSSLRK